MSVEGSFEVSEIGETTLSVSQLVHKGCEVAFLEINRIVSPWVDSDR